MLLGVALRAQGGVGIACGVWWAAFGVPVCAWWVLWRFYGRVLKSAAAMGQVRVIFTYCISLPDW